MRIDLLPNGIVDDLAVELADATIERTGEARFVMRISGASVVELEIWTTRKQRVRVSPWENAPQPDWVVLYTATTDELESTRDLVWDALHLRARTANGIGSAHR